MIMPSCLRLANNGSCIVVQAFSYIDNGREKPSFRLKESYAHFGYEGNSSTITNAQKALASAQQHATASTTTSIIKEVVKSTSLSIAVIGATGQLAKGGQFSFVKIRLGRLLTQIIQSFEALEKRSQVVMWKLFRQILLVIQANYYCKLSDVGSDSDSDSDSVFDPDCDISYTDGPEPLDYYERLQRIEDVACS